MSRWLTSPTAVLAGLAVLSGTLLIRNAFFRDTVRYSLQGLALMPVITAAVLGREAWTERVRSVLNAPVMVLGGWLSYSLYLWHPALFALGPYLVGAKVPGILIGWVMALAVAWLSYYGIERPMMAIRSKFGSEQRRHRLEAKNGNDDQETEPSAVQEGIEPTGSGARRLYVVAPPVEPLTPIERKTNFFSSQPRKIP